MSSFKQKHPINNYSQYMEPLNIANLGNKSTSSSKKKVVFNFFKKGLKYFDNKFSSKHSYTNLKEK